MVLLGCDFEFSDGNNNRGVIWVEVGCWYDVRSEIGEFDKKGSERMIRGVDMAILNIRSLTV